jgi:hypothetical protein
VWAYSAAGGAYGLPGNGRHRGSGDPHLDSRGVRAARAAPDARPGLHTVCLRAEGTADTPGRARGGLRVRGHDRQDGQDLRPVRRAPRVHGLPADVDGGRKEDHPPPQVPAPRTAACSLAARGHPGQAVAVRPPGPPAIAGRDHAPVNGAAVMRVDDTALQAFLAAMEWSFEQVRAETPRMASYPQTTV